MQTHTSASFEPVLPPATEESTQQFLTFSVAGEQYGVDIMAVREIKGWTPATRLPNRPDYMRGVMNLRGAIIPIFDLRCRFGQGLTEPDEQHVIIILAVEERTIGILVEAVSDIVEVGTSEIRPAPQQETISPRDRFVTGLIAREDRMLVALDIARLFQPDELDAPDGEGHG